MVSKRLFVPHVPVMLFQKVENIDVSKVEDLEKLNNIIYFLGKDVSFKENISEERKLYIVKNFLNNRYNLESLSYHQQFYQQFKIIKYSWTEKFIDENGVEKLFLCKESKKVLNNKITDVILFTEYQNIAKEKKDDSEYKYFFNKDFLDNCFYDNENNEKLHSKSDVFKREKDIYEEVYKYTNSVLSSIDESDIDAKKNNNQLKQYNKLLNAIERDNPILSKDFEKIRTQDDFDVIAKSEINHREKPDVFEVASDYFKGLFGGFGK